MKLYAKFQNGALNGETHHLECFENADRTTLEPMAPKRQYLPKAINSEHYGWMPTNGPPMVTEIYELVEQRRMGDILEGFYYFDGKQLKHPSAPTDSLEKSDKPNLS